MPKSLGRIRRQRGAVVAFVIMPLAIMIAGAFAGSAWIDDHGLKFFDTGKSVVLHLATLANAIQARDHAGIAAALAAGVDGDDLSLLVR